jgi:MscS family membrane protein
LGPVLAFKLKYVIDRIGRVYLQEISNDPDGPRLVLYRGPLGRIVLGRHEEHGRKAWGFTTATVRQIEDMFQRSLDRPPDEKLLNSNHIRLAPEFLNEPGVWLRVHVPAALRYWVLGLQLYQWLGLVVVVLLAGTLAWLLRGVALLGIRWFFHWGDARTEQDALGPKLRGLMAVLFILALYKLLKWLDLPAALAADLYVAQKLVFILALSWAGFQIIDLIGLFYHHSEQLRSHRSLGDLLVPFFSTLAKFGLCFFAALYLINQFGQADTVTRFLAGVGIVGLAVSLAAQDSLKNLFGTLLLIGDRSFRIGDRLLIGDKEGVVEQVGFRSTKLRTPEDSLLILPNGMLASAVIDNMGLRKYRRVRMPFSVAVASPLDKAEALRDGLREYLNAHPSTDHSRVHVHLQRIGKAGIEFEISAYFEAKDLEGEKQAREKLTHEIIRQARALNVELALEK